MQAVYTTLREAEYRSTYPIAYWNIAPLRWAGPGLAARMHADRLAWLRLTLPCIGCCLQVGQVPLQQVGASATSSQPAN